MSLGYKLTIEFLKPVLWPRLAEFDFSGSDVEVRHINNIYLNLAQTVGNYSTAIHFLHNI